MPYKLKTPKKHGMKCVVCKQTSLKTELSFHRFPHKNPELLDKWLQALNMNKNDIFLSSRVCSTHFVAADFKRSVNVNCGKSLLKSSAVPSYAASNLLGSSSRPTSPKSVPALSELDDCQPTLSDTTDLMEITEDVTNPAAVDASTGPTSVAVQDTKKSSLNLSETARSAYGNSGITSASYSVLHKSVGLQVSSLSPLARTPPFEITRNAKTQTNLIYINKATQTSVCDTAPDISNNNVPVTSTPKTYQSSILHKLSVSDCYSSSEYSDDGEAEVTNKQDDSTFLLAEDEDCELHSEIDEMEDSVYQQENSNYEYILVNKANLYSLLNKKCLLSDCNCCISDLKESRDGAKYTFQTTCSAGHNGKWSSDQCVDNRQISKLSVALPSAAVLSGSTYTHTNEFLSLLNIKQFSEKHFYNIQREYVFPSVLEIFEKERESNYEELKARNDPIIIIGDGRCDSPGYSAKYCSYIAMDEATKKVIDFEIIQLKMDGANYSNQMEKIGFMKVMKRLQNAGITVSTFVSDRHIQIAAYIRNNLPNVDHQFDVWHVAKSFLKKLVAKSKCQGGGQLLRWSSNIYNHLWWAAATCKGNPCELRERFTSVLNHVSNKHNWTGNTFFHACEHLQYDENDSTDWIPENSLAFMYLQQLVLDSRLQKDLEHLTQFLHSGPVECFNSNLLKYCPKRQHFSYTGMQARTAICILNHNENVGRNKNLKEEDIKYTSVFPKFKKEWLLRPVYKKKSLDYLFHLMRKIDDYVSTNEHSVAKCVNEIPVPKNISGTNKPSFNEMYAHRQTRFASNFVLLNK